MRALDDYNKDRDRKLGSMVGTCMNSMWVCYFVMNICWLLCVCISGDFHREMLGSCLLPMLLNGAICLLYQWIVIKKERVIREYLAFIILNGYVVLLLLHPSGLIMLDGLVFGVIAMYPVWTDREWVKRQTCLFAVMILLRHVVLEYLGISSSDFWKTSVLIGMFCIGIMIYYNVEYVHKQTMVLGDATRMDAATGLYNHECFYEELEKRMKEFEQISEKEREEACFCLLIADIDNFKKVNDTYGHAFGDEVLLALAGIFKNYCGSKDFAARYGGEEFVLIVGGCRKKDALTRANTIRRRFADTIFTDASGEQHQFTVSLGVAEYDRPWNTASKFFDQSDQALYQAKNTGKNRVCSA